MTQWIEKITNTISLEELENLRIDTLGKKGILTLEFAKMKSVPNEEKKAFAENLNTQKELITTALESKKIVLEKVALNEKLENEKIDVTRFNNELTCGATHPVVETMDRSINYFQNLNIAVEGGPLVEADFNIFEDVQLYFLFYYVINIVLIVYNFHYIYAVINVFIISYKQVIPSPCIYYF